MAVKGEDRASLGLEQPRSDSESESAANVRDIHAYRIGLDETIPPMPLRELLSAGGANVYVLSADRTLFHAVQNASGEQYPVFVVEDWQALAAAIDSGHCGIALIDAEFLGDELIRRIESLSRYATRLVTLVAADRTTAEQLIGLLSDRKIHRLLIKPPAPGITRLLIESAVSRCIQLREIEAPIDGVPSLSVPARRRGLSVRARWLVAAASLAVLAGIVVIAGVVPGRWSLAPSRPASPASTSAASSGTVKSAASHEAAAPSATVASAPARGRFDDLLAAADRAFNEGRLAGPQGDDALDYYLTILAADPDQPTARDRLTQVVGALFTQAEAALLNHSLDSAGALLDQIRRADPSSARLAFMDAQLRNAKAEALAAADRERKSEPVSAASSQAVAPPKVAPPRAPTELESLLTIANTRLARGDLLEPAGDSAKAYLDRAAELDPNAAGVATLRGRLADAVVAEAGKHLQAGELDAAVQLVLVARNLGADSPALADLESRIGAANAAQARAERGRLMSNARARIAAGALVEPRDDSALHYLGALASQDPGYAGLADGWSDFERAAANRATAAIDKHDWAGATGWLDALKQVPGSDGSQLKQLSGELDTARLQEEYLRTPVAASVLPLLSYEPPAYPADAQRAGISGWVELEFVVGRDGKPRDVMAVAADPPGHFEQAAIEAVSKYQFQAFKRDGQVFERRVRLRVRFALK